MASVKKQKGFTLIEVLVVISIISLLSSTLWVSLGDSRAKANDARRIRDTSSMRNAMELYFADAKGYPSPTMWNSGTLACGSSNISRVPKDPGISSYSYRGLGRTSYSECSASYEYESYILCFKTEANSSLGPPGKYGLTPAGYVVAVQSNFNYPLLGQPDLDSDGFIGRGDAAIVSGMMGKRTGDLGFNPDADLNADGLISSYDLVFITRNVGRQIGTCNDI